jgi:hypothetical protein
MANTSPEHKEEEGEEAADDGEAANEAGREMSRVRKFPSDVDSEDNHDVPSKKAKRTLTPPASRDAVDLEVRSALEEREEDGDATESDDEMQSYAVSQNEVGPVLTPPCGETNDTGQEYERVPASSIIDLLL